MIFGVTGDLARKKLMPAIYDLANRGLLPPGFSLVGFARRDWADQDFGRSSTTRSSSTPARRSARSVWRQLAEGFRFVPGTFDDPDAFDLLAETVDEPGDASAAPAATTPSTCRSRPASFSDGVRAARALAA